MLTAKGGTHGELGSSDNKSDNEPEEEDHAVFHRKHTNVTSRLTRHGPP